MRSTNVTDAANLTHMAVLVRGLLFLSILMCWFLLTFGSDIKYQNQIVHRSKGEGQLLLKLGVERKFGIRKIGRLRVIYQAHAPKRKFSMARVKYTVNGDSSYNLQLTTQELLLAGDVELNPGDSSDSWEANLKEIKMPDKGLRIGQWNINRLTDAKFEQISLILTTYKNIDILFLIETFLKSTSKPDSVYNIPGYYLFRKDRGGSKNGGGLIAYVSDKVKVNRNCDLEDDFVESLWLTIYPHNSHRPLLVGSIYRPPSTDVATDSRIEQNIETAYLKNMEMILVGDMNINSLDKMAFSKHRLIKSLGSMNLSQLVNEVTRPVSNSCLDHIYTTHPAFISVLTVPNIGLADHLPVFICRKYVKINKDSSHKVINYHDFKNLNVENLLEDLS